MAQCKANNVARVECSADMHSVVTARVRACAHASTTAKYCSAHAHVLIGRVYVERSSWRARERMTGRAASLLRHSACARGHSQPYIHYECVCVHVCFIMCATKVTM
jgi:hypothetical protein